MAESPCRWPRAMKALLNEPTVPIPNDDEELLNEIPFKVVMDNVVTWPTGNEAIQSRGQHLRSRQS